MGDRDEKVFSGLCVGAAVVPAPISKTDAQEKLPLRLVRRFRCQTSKAHRSYGCGCAGQAAFVAGLENGSLEVVDPRRRENGRRSVPDFKKTQGVAYVPSLNKVFVASGTTQCCRVFRADSLELIDSVKLEPGPNRVTYDPHTSVCT